jgi:uncharacterized protein YggE
MNFNRVRKLTLVFVLIAAVVLVMPTSAQDAPTTPRVITVTGEGMAYGNPEIAFAGFTIETVNTDLATVFTHSDQTIANIVATLQSLGVAATDIVAGHPNITVQDQLDASGVSTGQRAYRLNNSVQVTIRDLSQIGAILSAGVASGANSISDLSFGRGRAILEQRARSLAIADAKARAEQLAAELGVTVGTPITITETQDPDTSQLYYKGLVLTTSNYEPIGQEQLSVTINVEVTFSII